MSRTHNGIRSLLVTLVAIASVHCSSANASTNANASASSNNAQSSSGAASATTGTNAGASASATPWLSREEAERRLRASAMVTEHLRSERATYGNEPEIAVGVTPSQGCAAGSPQCLWIFNTEMRTSSTHAEPLYFAVDPYSGAVSRCSDEDCRERSDR